MLPEMEKKAAREIPRKGRQRSGSSCSGRTAIKESRPEKVIADMSGDNRRQIVLKGGKRRTWKSAFATATMQVPKYAQPGQPAMELEVNLELKVIADVGLIGFPNVGKSTFLSRVTNAQPKIANYHFTTLNPNLEW